MIKEERDLGAIPPLIPLSYSVVELLGGILVPRAQRFS